MDSTEESPVILSFCTGIRGLERGIERVIGPVRVAAYVEIEAFIIYNLVAAMESGVLDPSPIWSDLKTFPAQDFSGKVHGIIGGYPCQPFSNAGNRKGEEDPRHLWPYIKHHISTIRPVWCFFENVAGHLTLGFQTVKRELEEMGYLVEAGIYSAEEVGAPHRRERLFILAVLDNTSGPRLEGRLGGHDTKRSARTGRMQTAGTGKNVADTLRDNGAEIQIEAREPVIGSEPFSNGNQGRVDRFPAGRGAQQFNWEAPRTTESSMGSTAHGYNFREDLLRALGNGVVEQTAELAFRDLIRKQFEDGTEQNI